jgi:hypothetical protein
MSERIAVQLQQELAEKVRQRLKVETVDKHAINFSGIIILTAPVNWEEAIQVIVDLLSTPNGNVTAHHSYEHQQTHIPVMACYNDLFSIGAHPLPRLLMKPFTESLKTVYRLVYGD